MSGGHWLDEPCTTTAFAWTLRRRDGVALGFTSHDRDLEIEGLLFRAAPGLVPSAIVESATLDDDGLDIDGGIASDLISERDLDSGRWDGAALEVHLVDWTAPSRRRLLAAGSLGEIARSGNAFQAQLRGPAAALDHPVAPRTSPACRADFGGPECGIDLMYHRSEGRIVSVRGEELTLADLADDARYRFGRLRFLSGPNCGTMHDIADGQGDRIWLTAVPALPVDAGARVMLWEGCDRSIDSCAARFGNAVNFRGEPHLPGNDLLTRYAGAT